MWIEIASRWTKLDIALPTISDAIQTTNTLEGLTFEDVQDAFKRRGLKPLPVGQPRNTPIEYEERHLFTNEVVARMDLDPGLLANAWSAPAYFARMLGRACQITNPHAVLAPLIERFICEVLFERPVSLYGGEVDRRMRDMDVIEHIRAVFTPLILSRTVRRHARQQLSQRQLLSSWKPYQVTSNEKRPAVPAARTLFNLVPCENDFERAFVAFLDQAGDVVAFAKNAGPQKLMIDYLKPDGQRGLYAPDFFARAADGTHYLIELKGRQDNLVTLKARAANEWCQAASASGARWEYLYVLYEHFQPSAVKTIAELARACAPAMSALLAEQVALPLDETDDQAFGRWLTEAGLDQPPAEHERAIREAVTLLEDLIRKGVSLLGPAFQPLLGPLDDYAQRILEQQIKPAIPAQDHERFFWPSLANLPKREREVLEKNQRYLFSTLVDNRPMQRLGTLLFCPGYAQKGDAAVGGVWQVVRQRFSTPAFQKLYALLNQVNQFRNVHIAHGKEPLRDPEVARAAMRTWLTCLNQMAQLSGGASTQRWHC